MNAVKRFSFCCLFLLMVFSMACANEPAKADRPDGEPDFLRCSMKPERGPCKALFEKFYFDEKGGECKAFFWGGCQGAVPFETKQACENVCLPPQTVKITKIKVLEDKVYAAVELEFPKDWRDPRFTVELNGKQVRTRRWSGGFSTDRSMASFLIFPGKAGKKTVTVKAVAGGRKIEAKGTFDWQKAAFLNLLQHTGDRELLLTKEKLYIAAVNVNDVRIVFNGNDTHPRMSREDITIFSFEPEWKKGRNALAVSAIKHDGSVIAKNYSFFYLEDGGTLVAGETVLLQYGREGSKSGPFYDLKFEGSAIAPLKAGSVNNYIVDRDGWLGKEARLTQELRAERAGASKVRILVKHHFLQDMELEKEFMVTVRER